MCISTVPLAMAACTCGGMVDEEAYAICTDDRILEINNCKGGYIICNLYAVDIYEDCMNSESNQFLCNQMAQEIYDNCEDCIIDTTTEWQNCTDAACS